MKSENYYIPLYQLRQYLFDNKHYDKSLLNEKPLIFNQPKNNGIIKLLSYYKSPYELHEYFRAVNVDDRYCVGFTQDQVDDYYILQKLFVVKLFD